MLLIVASTLAIFVMLLAGFAPLSLQSRVRSVTRGSAEIASWVGGSAPSHHTDAEDEAEGFEGRRRLVTETEYRAL